MKEALQGIEEFIQNQPEELRSAFVQEQDLTTCVAEQQPWGPPYDERYLVLSFGGFDFKLTDLLVLSSGPAAPDGGPDDVIDFVPAQSLRGGPWLTACGLSKVGGEVYLHFYFVGPGARVRHTSRTIAVQNLPERPSPDTRDGVVSTPHPRVPPGELGRRATAAHSNLTAPASMAAAAVFGSPTLPYDRLFLSFDGWTFPQMNCWPVAGQVQPYDYVALSDKDPTSATDHYKNGYCYVNSLSDGIYYNFLVWARTWGGAWRHQKWHNDNLWTLDLDAAANLRMWYVRWQDGQWQRVGDVVRFQSDHSNWMRENHAAIGGKKLHEIAIPGTHDSGCFDLYAKLATREFSQSQNLDFAGQLQYGVRYFDVRLYLAADGHYYFNHSTTKTYTKLDDFVAALAAFLQAPNNQEIVIADLSRFGQGVGTNFQASDYRKIIEMFSKHATLGALLTNGAQTTKTIDELVKGGRRVVLLCDQANEGWFQNICDELEVVVPDSINQDAEWANAHATSTLKAWLQKEVTAHAGLDKLWSLQAQLTPIPLLQNMQEVATNCNALAAKWVHELWWKDVNVVFADFITGGGLVEVLIDCNRRRAGGPTTR